MDMHPPPAYAQLAQAQRAPLDILPSPPPQQAAPVEPAPPPDEQAAPVEPTPTKVDVSRYIPSEAITATIILTLSPPTGWALVYTEGSEDNGTVFKGGKSVGEIKLDGRYIYVKLYGPTSFSIQYINYHVP
jgi:hypothetical protein